MLKNMPEQKCSLSKEAMIKNLETCLASEEKALSLYEELLLVLEDELDKKRIEMIANDERRHVDIVKNTIDVIRVYYND